MIRINLLPFRAARKKENVRRQISIFLLSFIFLLVVVIYYNVNLNQQIDRLKVKNKETTVQLKKYEKINKEIAEIYAISPRTVETQIYRALKVLKESLRPYMSLTASLFLTIINVIGLL